LKTPVQLDLEQVIVKSGRIELPVRTSRIPGVGLPPKPVTLAGLRKKTIDLVKESCEDLRQLVKPYPIMLCGVRFLDRSEPTAVLVTIARDYPFSEEEQRWLATILGKKLGEPLQLDLETEPFLPPIVMGKDGKPVETGRKALSRLKLFDENGFEPHIEISTPRVKGKRSNHMRRDVANLTSYLVNEMEIPPSNISRAPEHSSELRVRVASVKEKSDRPNRGTGR
jgi:hypothetical protein